MGLWAGLGLGGGGGGGAVFGVDVGDSAVFPCRALADAVIRLAQVRCFWRRMAERRWWVRSFECLRELKRIVVGWTEEVRMGGGTEPWVGGIAW